MFTITLIDPCISLEFASETISDIEYTAGDEIIMKQISDFTASPISIATQCPEVTHSYTYQMVSGTIEEEWLTFDEISQLITFWAPATFENEPV